MDILQLRCFVQAARSGSGTAAANSLHVSQPTLSKAISSLESELGTQLFDRLGRKLILNEYGRLFLRYCEHSLTNLDEGARMLTFVRRETLGTVTIESHVFSVVLADCLAAFGKLHPLVNFRYTSAEGRSIDAAPVGDIIIYSRSRDEISSAMFYPVTQKLLVEKYYYALPPSLCDFPPEKTEIAMEETRDIPFIVMNHSDDFGNNSTSSTLTLRYYMGFTPPRVIEANNYPLKLALLERGMGGCLLPEVCLPMTRKFIPDLRVFTVKDLDTTRRICVGRRRREALSEVAMTFWNFLLDYYHLSGSDESDT